MGFSTLLNLHATLHQLDVNNFLEQMVAVCFLDVYFIPRCLFFC